MEEIDEKAIEEIKKSIENLEDSLKTDLSPVMRDKYEICYKINEMKLLMCKVYALKDELAKNYLIR